MNYLKASPPIYVSNAMLEYIETCSKLKPFIEEPPTLDLKLLPSHISYEFLGEGETLSIITSSILNQEQDAKLLCILKQFKKAIGWSIVDIKGIIPSIYMHKILLEKGAKIAKDAQHRLNPIMKEVVNK